MLDQSAKLGKVHLTNSLDFSLSSLESAACRYFLDNVDPVTGLIFDSNSPQSDVSISATGFGLAAYVVMVARGELDRKEAAERILRALRFLWNAEQSEKKDATGYMGFFYHFLTRTEGKRAGGCELSVIDTALLVAGILCAQVFFDQSTDEEREICTLADQIYRRIDWSWPTGACPAISHGWKPESGFLHHGWEGYSEALILYILGLGSPTHPLPHSSYCAWRSTYQWENLYGYYFLYSGILFVHQFSQIWVDFRGLQDESLKEKGIDYFENTRRAISVQQEYCKLNPHYFKGYGEYFWGITALGGPGDEERWIDGVRRNFLGYSARSIPYGPDDGTIAPWAVAASIPFSQDIALKTLDHILKSYPGVRKEDGMLRSFNPTYTNANGEAWVSKDLFGIEQGPVALMIANHKDALIWNLFKKCPYLRKGLEKAEFVGGWL